MNGKYLQNIHNFIEIFCHMIIIDIKFRIVLSYFNL